MVGEDGIIPNVGDICGHHTVEGRRGSAVFNDLAVLFWRLADDDKDTELKQKQHVPHYWQNPTR